MVVGSKHEKERSSDPRRISPLRERNRRFRGRKREDEKRSSNIEDG